jgi:C4-type Zn-finger protein
MRRITAILSETRSCPTCGNRMTLFNTIPGVASLPALRTYKCEECGVRKTETKEARDDSIFRPTPNLNVVPAKSSLLH